MSTFRDRLSKLEQRFALRLLAEAERGPVILTKYRGSVANEEGWGSYETLKKAADNLVELGLVRIEPKGHPKTNYLTITEKGRTLIVSVKESLG